MNFMEDYVKYANDQTEAPRRYHFYMAYLLLSQVVGKKATYSGADRGSGPNLWMIFLGPSSVARKSSTIKIATDILRDVYVGENYTLPTEGSFEAWIEAFTDMEKDNVTQGLMVYHEYASLNAWTKRDYNIGLTAILMQAYDQIYEIKRRVGTRGKAKEYIIKSPFLNIACASTLEWFYGSIDELKISSGFLPRFHIIYSNDDSKIIPRRPPVDLLEKNKLVSYLQGIKEKQFGPMDYTPEAGKLYDKWYRERKMDMKNVHPTMVPFIQRRLTEVHKFAMLNSIVSGSAPLMNEDDLDKAICIEKNIIDDTEMIITKKIALTPFQADHNKLLEIIKKLYNGNGGAPKWRVIRQSRFSKKKTDEILDTMVESKIITVKSVATEGRPALVYEPCDKNENDRSD